MTDRFQQLRRHLRPGQVGVEVGAFYSPIAPKRDGYETVVVDVSDRATLIEHAGRIAGLPAGAIDLIEEVDIVLRDGASLAEACLARRPQGYDFLVGSHSLEHVPDLLGFFQEADRLLAPGAVISQALPDLRFCFDFFRPHTTTGQVLLAHRCRHRRPLPETLFDAEALRATRDGAAAWIRQGFDVPRADTDLAAAYAVYQQALAEDGRPEAPYRDAHCWCFTPAVFETVLFDLNVLGLVPFVVAGIELNLGSEFIVHLRRGEAPRSPDVVRERRNELIRRATRELMERFPW